MGLTAVFALTACGGKGKEVKAEDLEKKAAEIEDHEYSQATIKYSYSGTMKEAGGEEEKVDEKATVTYKFDKESKGWTTEDKEHKYASYFADYLHMNLKELAELGELDISAEAMAQYKEYGDIKVHYYTDPFGLEASAKFNYDQDGSVVKGSMSSYSNAIIDKVEEALKNGLVGNDDDDW